jgi:hypothetical protein
MNRFIGHVTDYKLAVQLYFFWELLLYLMVVNYWFDLRLNMITDPRSSILLMDVLDAFIAYATIKLGSINFDGHLRHISASAHTLYQSDKLFLLNLSVLVVFEQRDELRAVFWS